MERWSAPIHPGLTVGPARRWQSFLADRQAPQGRLSTPGLHGRFYGAGMAVPTEAERKARERLAASLRGYIVLNPTTTHAEAVTVLERFIRQNGGHGQAAKVLMNGHLKRELRTIAREELAARNRARKEARKEWKGTRRPRN